MGKAAAQCHRKIGVLDSGVGGLTVVRELTRVLPGESIVYYGDNGNCPYGNRTADNIVAIAQGILNFLREKDVKLVVLACNTTSSLLHRIAPGYSFPVFGVIEPAADYVAQCGFQRVGVIATELTIRTGRYEKLIHERAPGVQVFGEPSHNLAKLVDSGDFDMAAIEAEIRPHMQALTACGAQQVIYGCTHYPIVDEVFRKIAPGIEFIDPARQQALAVQAWLLQSGLQSTAARGGAEIYTTGGPEAVAVYRDVFRRLDIHIPAAFAHIPVNAK